MSLQITNIFSQSENDEDGMPSSSRATLQVQFPQGSHVAISNIENIHSTEKSLKLRSTVWYHYRKTNDYNVAKRVMCKHCSKPFICSNSSTGESNVTIAFSCIKHTTA